MLSDPVTSVFNDAYIAEVFESYRRDPSSVDESWRQFFRFAESLGGALPEAAAAGTVRTVDTALLAKAAGAASLVDSIHEYGHLAARIDPLGNTPPGTPELNPEFHGLTEADLEAIPGEVLRAPEATAAEVVKRLRSLYSNNIGFEFDHLGDAEEREWLKSQIESGRVHEPLSADEKRAMLRRLTEVDGLERFIGRVYQGYKRFSIEGSDMMVPMLDTAIESCAALGASEVTIAMAHRGRINVLAHILEKPYRTIFGEFEGRHAAANAESETGERAMGARVRVAAHHGHPRQGRALFRTDDVHDALLPVEKGKIGLGAKFLHVGVERLDLQPRYRVGNACEPFFPVPRRRIVIGGRNDGIHAPRLAAGELEPLVRLRARHLVHEMAVDVEQHRAVLALVRDVAVPQFVVERARRHIM